MRIAIVACSAFVALCAEPGAQTAAQASRYRLHVLPWGTTSGRVNARGDVIARSYSYNDSFAWSRSGGIRTLDPRNGFLFATAHDLDSAGVVVGMSWNHAERVPTLWSPSGTPLPIPGTPVGTAIAINDAGAIVGMSDATQPPSAWLWDALHGVRPLADFGLTVGLVPSDLSSSGYVVGGGPSASAFRLDLGTSTMVPLTTGYGGAHGVNEQGHVVGWSVDAFFEVRPFLWTPADGLQYLGSLNPPWMFIESGRALSINDSGVVVGESEASTDFYHAFVWDQRNGMRDLNGLVDNHAPYEFLRARHISRTGWIAGDAVDRSSGDAPLVFVLQPIL